MKTADLSDAHGDLVRVLEPKLLSYGAVREFQGAVTTLRVLEDNALVRATLETRGMGRILVVDGGGSLRSALVGGNLGKLAEKNGWTAIVVWGAVRDSAELATCEIGILALATMPKKSEKKGLGEEEVTITIGGVTIETGDWLYADEDGTLVAPRELTL